MVAIAFYAVAGLAEAALIRVLQPSEMELDWISDVVLSSALGVSMYLWLHLRATRLALTERERAQVILESQLSMAEAMQRRLLPPDTQPTSRLRMGGTPDTGRQDRQRLLRLSRALSRRVPCAHRRHLGQRHLRGDGAHAPAFHLSTTRPRHAQSCRAQRSNVIFALREWHGSPYVTCVIARLDLARQTMTYTNAGHPSGMLVRDGQIRELAVGGPPLGLFACATYAEAQIDLTDGDVCVFVTDGITEALDNGLGSPRTVVTEAIREQGRSAPAVCTAVMSRARDAHGPTGVDDWTDDRTVVVMSFNDSRHLSNQRRGSTLAVSARPASARALGSARATS